jgi:hypothetical protein
MYNSPALKFKKFPKRGIVLGPGISARGFRAVLWVRLTTKGKTCLVTRSEDIFNIFETFLIVCSE